MSDRLTEEQVETVTSYVDGYYRVMHQTGMTQAELDDALLDHNVEECPFCAVYSFSFDMVNDDTGEVDGRCTNCRTCY